MSFNNLEGSIVELAVYDLSRGFAKSLSKQLVGEQIDAIYHTGVRAYGLEFFYGGGIQAMPAEMVEQTYGMEPIDVLFLGETGIPFDLFQEFIASISENYTSDSYDILYHNCNHFSDEAVSFLLGQNIPSYILNLPQDIMNTPFGNMIAPLLNRMNNPVQDAPNPSNETNPAASLPFTRSPPTPTSSRPPNTSSLPSIPPPQSSFSFPPSDTHAASSTTASVPTPLPTPIASQPFTQPPSSQSFTQPPSSQQASSQPFTEQMSEPQSLIYYAFVNQESRVLEYAQWLVEQNPDNITHPQLFNAIKLWNESVSQEKPSMASLGLIHHLLEAKRDEYMKHPLLYMYFAHICLVTSLSVMKLPERERVFPIDSLAKVYGSLIEFSKSIVKKNARISNILLTAACNCLACPYVTYYLYKQLPNDLADTIRRIVEVTDREDNSAPELETERSIVVSLMAHLCRIAPVGGDDIDGSLTMPLINILLHNLQTEKSHIVLNQKLEALEYLLIRAKDLEKSIIQSMGVSPEWTPPFPQCVHRWTRVVSLCFSVGDY